MTIMVCGQNEVLPGSCPECGGWLHREQKNGFEGPYGVRYCCTECIDDYVEHSSRLDASLRGRRNLDAWFREHCAICGHFIDFAWVSEWNYFSYEPRPFCRRCPVPVDMPQRHRYLTNEGWRYESWDRPTYIERQWARREPVGPLP